MAKQETFDAKLETVKRAFSDIFSGRVLAWQLGGTILAALCFAVACSIPTGSSRFGAFILTGLGFIAAYVVLSATGCIVTRILDTSGHGKDETDGGVAPLHFLIDNIGTVTLLPLVASGAAVACALIFYLLSLPAGDNAWQTILVLLAPIPLILAVLIIADLFILLFIVPSMVVTEQPPFGYALRRLWRLGCARKMAMSKTFGVGLAASTLAILPAALVLFAAASACSWTHFSAASGPPGDFGRFMLRLYCLALLCAPVSSVALAFLNALSYNAYGELVEGLDEEAESDEDTEENGSALSGGEEPDLEVEDDKERKDAND
ncbi:MAG: hypothetical protein ABIF82_05895 [Planctomycetota bacterium]